MNNVTKWAEPVTYGDSKFEVMTDELHARPVAVVNALEDARLIAAAPELLAALKTAVHYLGFEYPSTDPHMVEAYAAIAKATGA